MALKWPFKDPDETLDYKIDWLGSTDEPGPLFGLSDAIDDSLWIVPAELTSELEQEDDETTTIWLSGGVEGTTYEVVNRITTAAGRVMDQTMKLKIKTK